MNLQTIKQSTSLALGNAKLLAKAKSPQIMIATGIVAGVTATVFACKATLHVEEVIDGAKEQIDECKEAFHNSAEITDGETPVVYNENHYKRDVTIIYTQTGVKLARLYAPAIFLGIVSIGSILGGYHILNKRNIAITAAFKALDETFKGYRDRVREKYGEEIEKRLYNNTHMEKISVIDEETGKKKKESVEVAGDGNMYSFRFNHNNMNWNSTTEYNEIYLKNQEHYANDLFSARGHIFLNEILDLLGIERVDFGQLVGWKKGNGDDYVDFGVTRMLEPVGDSGILEEVFVMNFNVDGETWDQI